MRERRLSAEQRRTISERAGGCCEYCRSQERFSPQPFAIEHILPQSSGGPTTLDNLAFACQGCNNHKYIHTAARDPATGTTVPLFHPRQQHWQAHFTWNDDYTRVLGLTPTGRATVVTLRLNRPGLVNLRRALYAVGLHPPPEAETT